MKSWVQNHDIKLLRIFYTIAKYGGFAQAQIKLNLSQSSVSTYMSQLETRIGVSLCTRGHSGFSLTDEGRAVLEEIETLFDALETFATKVAETRGELFGHLFLGVIESSVTHPNQQLINALAAFRKQAPNVDINMYAGGALELEDRVLDNRLHVASGIFPHRVDGLEYRPLFEERHFLYCAEGHPLFCRDTQDITLGQLAEYPFASRGYVDLIKGLEPPAQFRASAVAPHMEGLLYLVLTGAYFVYLPDHTAKQWVQQGRLRRIDAEETERRAMFHLILKKGKQHPRVLREFLGELEKKSFTP